MLLHFDVQLIIRVLGPFYQVYINVSSHLKHKGLVFILVGGLHRYGGFTGLDTWFSTSYDLA